LKPLGPDCLGRARERFDDLGENAVELLGALEGKLVLAGPEQRKLEAKEGQRFVVVAKTERGETPVQAEVRVQIFRAPLD